MNTDGHGWPALRAGNGEEQPNHEGTSARSGRPRQRRARPRAGNGRVAMGAKGEQQALCGDRGTESAWRRLTEVGYCGNLYAVFVRDRPDGLGPG
jgi:hypothetical protein